MSSYIMAAQKCGEKLSAMRRRASPANSSRNTSEPLAQLVFTDEPQIFTKVILYQPNLPPSRWKRIRAAPQKAEAKCTQRVKRASEAILEALRLAMCMGTAMSSLTTRSCETCCGTSPGRSRIGISRSGGGGMRAWGIITGHHEADDWHTCIYNGVNTLADSGSVGVAYVKGKEDGLSYPKFYITWGARSMLPLVKEAKASCLVVVP